MKEPLTPADIVDRYINRYREFEKVTGVRLTVDRAASHIHALLSTHDMKFDPVLSRRLEEIMPIQR